MRGLSFYIHLDIYPSKSIYMKHRLLISGLRSILSVLFLGTALAGRAQYCESYLDDATYEHITHVNFAGISNSSADDSGGPVDYTSQVATVAPGGSFLLSVGVKSDQMDYIFAFIDWDQDEELDGADEVYVVASDIDQDGIYTLEIVPPAGALAGSTRMRVMIVYNNDSEDPCVEDYYGEAEDYTVDVVTGACAGMPSPGNTIASETAVCASESFALGLQNPVGGTGITYQWQSSPDGTTFTDIAGATSSGYAGTQSETTFYRCVVSCGGSSANSTAVEIELNTFLECYCVSMPVYSDAEDILNVKIGTLNNTSACDETGTGDSQLNLYSDYTDLVPTVLQRGVSYPLSIEVGACEEAYENMTKVFIDYNQDGDFEDAGEEVYVTPTAIDGPHVETGMVLIPMSAPLGTTRMRVITSETTYPDDITPCGNEYYYAGETEDYFVTIGPAPTCPQPTALQWQDGSTSSADISWTPGGSETEWTVEYGPAGFTPGSGEEISVTAGPEAHIPGLDDNTFYDVYVTAVCSSSDQSYATGPLHFDTYGYGQYLEADKACGPGFIDISATGTEYQLGDDDGTSITFPFPVYYQGAMYTDATLSNNGGIAFGSTYTDIDWDNGAMVEAPTGLYPFWDDLGTSGPGIWVATTGTAPNRRFIVQWNKEQINAEGDPFNFELIIEEATMEIYYAYEDVLAGDAAYNYGASASIGAAGPNQDIDVSLFDTDYLRNNECAHFYYTNCPRPQNIAFSNIAIDEFSVEWSAGFSGETEWSMEFGPHGFLPGTGTPLTDLTSPDQQIPSLDPITTYDVYVYAVCANGQISAPLIGSVQTKPLCADPYALYGSAAEDSLFMEWQWTETEVPLTGFRFRYGSEDFDLYGPGSHLRDADGTNFADTIDDAYFMAGVTYDVYLQAVCDNDTSNFIGPFTVTMPLTNDTVCYAETLLADGTLYVLSNEGSTATNSVGSNLEQTIAPPNTGLQTTTGWGNSSITNSTWFKFTAPASGSVRISGTDIGFNGQMAVYKVGNCASFSSFQLIAANDDEIGGTSLAPNFTVCGLTENQTYYLLHDSYDAGATGIYSIRITPIVHDAGTSGPMTEICSGQTVDLFDHISGYEAGGTWIPVIPSAVVQGSSFNSSGLGAGIFKFQYRVTEGCAYDSVVTSIKVFPPSSAGVDGSLVVCRNQPFNLLQGLTGSVDLGGTWYNPNAAVVPGGNAVSDNFPGQYNYRYIVGNGVCPNDTSKVVVNVQNCNYLGLDEQALESISLYPNPTDGQVYISSGSTQVFSYEVLDLNGRRVMTRDNAIGGTAVTEVDLGNMETGVYMIRVFNENAGKTFRVVVK